MVMSTRILAIGVVALVAFGCSERSPVAPASPAALAPGAIQAAADVPAPVEVRRFSDDSVVVGARSTLVRNDAGVRMTIHTSDLESGAAYTVWWVVFNNPGACDGGCDADDFGNPAVGASVVFATGHVLPPTGVGNFADHLKVGDTRGALFGAGLQAPRGAEIHLVIRSHGAPIPGLVHEQISSVEGGCHVNVCEDTQFAAHHP